MVAKPLLAVVAMLLIAANAPPNCTGCDFARADLAGRDFSNVNYVGADFKDSNLRNTTFTHANLTGVDFSGADLRGARFDGATCTGCDLKRVTIDSSARGLFFDCTGCDAQGLDISGFDLAGARLIGVDFQNADLRNVNLRGAAVCWHNHHDYDSDEETECIDLRGANVSGADFSGVRLCDGRHADRCTPVDAATLRRYSHSDLAGARLP